MNPLFQAGGALPADHPTYVERQADREALRAALNGEYLHIIAPRQIGKTSLLKRLAVKLGEMGWRCAYVDLSTLMDFSKPVWYAELGKILASWLTPGQIPSLANQVDLRRYLLDQALPWYNSQPRIALFFDEVESASKPRDTDGAPFSDTFFMTLRNLYIQRDTYNGTIVVALAGAVNPTDLVKDPDISPFNVGHEIGLDDFTARETRTLTERLTELGLPVDEDVHQVIYAWTSGHPYLTQRICTELEITARKGGLTTITSDIVTRIVEQVILNPTNPLQRDKNLRHVAKMLNDLSAPAAHLWSRLRSGDSPSLTEVGDFTYLELYLTGVVNAKANRLVIRNQIYENAFIEKHPLKMATTLESQTRNSAMGKAVRVFISSTWEDLQPEREAVEKALHRMRDTAFAGMEYFGSRPETPKEVSLAEVDRSDVYVGIFAHRYGSGITEAEYRRARQQDIPCLIYFKDDSVPVPPAHIDRDAERIAKLETFKRELKARHTISTFKSPDHLATQIVADLHNLLRSALSVREEKPARPGPKYQITIGSAQGIAIGDNAQVTQVFGTAQPLQSSKPSVQSPHDSTNTIAEIRLKHLTDNIRKDLVLLKDYEDALRYEDDPRRRAKYRREIEQLRESAVRYQQEYEELRAQVIGTPSTAMREIATQLHKMDDKLNALLSTQDTIRNELKELRRTMLARFDANEQAIIAAVLERLDENQLATVQTVLDAIESGRIAENELQGTLTAFQQALAQLQQQKIFEREPALSSTVEHASNAIAAPTLDVKHKLKITTPIIPMILSYEGEVGLGSRLNLEATWQGLIAKIRGRQ